MDDIRLGPFQLIRPVGEGGVGVVWEGVHEHGVPVAVKVLTQGTSRGERGRVSFRNEVRAVARLEHPGIVAVLDHGEVDARADRASGGVLAEGSPYLAMELATGGSLQDLPPGVGWTELRGILLALLEGLAHAHAHGLIHRDLKPANVLICAEHDLRPGLKLTDFGIAQAMDELQETRGTSIAGTPSYMAPEQLVGRWRDCGPWTDLYALGCMAWKLATGKTPFHGRHGPALVRAQLMEAPSGFRPLHPVPEGFEDWLRRLLSKEANQRFLRAADAAWHLRALVPPDTDGPPTRLPAHLGTPAGAPPPGAQEDEPTVSVPQATPVGAPPRRPIARDTPPVPTTWRSPFTTSQPVQLVGAGLGLYGLRAGRFVGRETERDRLWSELRTAASHRRARVTVLRGPSGTGKSRLARWLGDRAHEVGAAHVLLAENAASDGPTEALRRMMVRALVCSGLWRGQVLERVTEALEERQVDDPALAQDLTDILMGEGDVENDHIRRYDAYRRLLRTLCNERPAVLIFEDVHVGSDCLGLVEHLLRSPEPLPILALLTVRDDALAEQPDASARLAAIERHERVSVQGIGRLEPAAHEALVQELLRLEHRLAVRVASRTDGNPLFAVQLVGDWVRRGALEVGPDGFRLRAGEAGRLPDDVHVVWADRVTRAVEGLPRRARQDLERAAVLGAEFRDPTWHEACGDDTVSHAVRAALLDRMHRDQLLIALPDGWRFAHGMLRESLLRQATEAGRLQDHHRACAVVLLGQRRRRMAVSDEQLGFHLVEAGRPLDAVDMLLAAVQERKKVGYGLALSLAQRCEEILQEARLPDSDRRWGALLFELGELYRLRGEFDRARVCLDRAVDLARRHGHRDDLRKALFYRAVTEHNAERRAEKVVPLLDQLYALAAADQDPVSLGRYFHLLADYALTPEARTRIGWDAVHWFTVAGDLSGLANCYLQLAQVASTQWALEEARRLFELALERHEQLGTRSALARNGLADVLRHLGHSADAEALYRRAFEQLETVGDHDAYYPLLNLGILALEQGAWLEAWQRFERGRQMAEAIGRDQDVAIAWLLMLPCAASQREWHTFESYLAKVRAAGTGRRRDRDAAYALELAGDLAAAQRPDLARQCWAWAREEWGATGRPERAAALARKLR